VNEIERLQLLASAIAGRTLEVADAGAGELAWTDGTTVFVDAATSARDLIRTLAVQASLVAAGSLDPAVLGRLTKRRGVARRYLSIEGHRALVANEPVLPELVRSLIDRHVASSVDGTEASLAIALGRQRVDDPPPSFGVIRPRRYLAAFERAEGASRTLDRPEDPRLGRRFPELEDDTDDEDDVPSLGHLVSSPVGGGGVLGRLLQHLLAPSRAPEGGGPLGADAPTHVGRGQPRGTGTVTVMSGAAAPDATTAVEQHGTTYPEWDVYRKRYRPDWCTVLEADLAVEEAAPMTMPDGHELRRPLARLGLGLVRCRRQLQGDDIDIDAAVEARVEALAGTPPDDALYVESLRRRRDLAVVIVLDVSGSAGETGPTGRSVHEHQRWAAAALTAALHDLGDRVALYAFNSRGRAAVHVRRVKSFDDLLDSRVGQRLGGLVPGGYTRLGAAIRHGASLVDERGGTSRRLLVVISDGLPYDHGYEGRYAEADARRALAEARRNGVGCLCLSVGSGVDAGALRRVFGTAAHATVPTPEQLPRVIGPLFRAALQSAEAQRRVFRRKERSRERLAIEMRAS
jgi:nitric oxide reductase NorD protein